MAEIKRMKNENDFEYKLRLCKMKINKELDLDWVEIVDLLGLDVSGDHLRKVAYGIVEYDNYVHSSNTLVAITILSISDLHIPFQLDFHVLEKYKGVDILQLNGDICDMQSISTFDKVYRESPMEEIIMARNYLIELISYIKPKKVVVTYGNHDIRFERYLAKNLDSDLLELMPRTPLELIFQDGFKHFNKRERVKNEYIPLKDVFTDVAIEYVDNWYCQIGDAVFCHPTAFSSGILKTAEKAMLWFRNNGFNFKQLIMAHTHRSGQYSIGNTTIYEQGAFCDVEKNNYSNGRLVNTQKEGFIYLCQDKDGNTIQDKTRLVVLN